MTSMTQTKCQIICLKLFPRLLHILYMSRQEAIQSLACITSQLSWLLIELRLDFKIQFFQDLNGGLTLKLAKGHSLNLEITSIQLNEGFQYAGMCEDGSEYFQFSFRSSLIKVSNIGNLHIFPLHLYLFAFMSTPPSYSPPLLIPLFLFFFLFHLHVFLHRLVPFLFFRTFSSTISSCLPFIHLLEMFLFMIFF